MYRLGWDLVGICRIRGAGGNAELGDVSEMIGRI